jgi:hypothetical protein
MYIIGLNYVPGFDYRFAATLMCGVAGLFTFGEVIRLYVWQVTNSHFQGFK